MRWSVVFVCLFLLFGCSAIPVAGSGNNDPGLPAASASDPSGQTDPVPDASASEVAAPDQSLPPLPDAGGSDPGSRTATEGRLIASDYIPSAPNGVTVIVKVGETFTSFGCGDWLPTK